LNILSTLAEPVDKAKCLNLGADDTDAMGAVLEKWDKEQRIAVNF
jgi:hypothetical protein